MSQLPVGWEVKLLGDVCNVERGSSPRPIKNYITDNLDGVNWVKIGDTKRVVKYIRSTKQKITKEGAKRSRRVNPGDFILTNSMSYGKPYIMAITGCIHDGWFVLRLPQNIDADFFYYLLGSRLIQDQFGKLAAGAIVKNISGDLVKKTVLPIPPHPEQKRIVAILDEVFAGISQAVANAEKNLANARELFESYLNNVFTQKGEGWEDQALGDLTEKITKGSSPKWQGVSYVEVPGVLFVTSENVGTNTMIYRKTKYVEDLFNEKDSKSILKRGDVLTNIVGASIGRTAVFDRDDVANINQAVCLIRCDKDKLVNKFLAYLLNSPFFRKILHDNEIDNARANLSLGFFRSLVIPVPNLMEQIEITKNIDAFSAETQRLEAVYQQKLLALTELKQSFLQKAFAGELTLDPAKQVVNG